MEDQRPFRPDKVERARQRVRAGVYDVPAVLHDISNSNRLQRLWLAVDRCPVGSGTEYRDLSARLLAKCLSHVVDEKLVKTEVVCPAGRVDIDLPLKLEVLNAHSLWLLWAQRYDANSILVEVKNEAAKTDTNAVRQIESYLNHACKGRLGLLVSRAGFTDDAMHYLAAVARGTESLILPLIHPDLRAMARFPTKSAARTARFLRQKQTTLMQFS